MSFLQSAPATDEIPGSIVAAWFHRFHKLISDQENWLTELDAAIGDGDHGVIIRAGAAAADQAARDSEPGTAGAVLKVASKAFSSAAGGAGGILFATFFDGLSATLLTHTTVTLSSFADAFADAVSDVQDRGRSEIGDKTMVDALRPAANALQDAARRGLTAHAGFAAAASAATAGRDRTYSLPARRGRASYLGDRSKNHLDPGAATAALLLDALTSNTTTTQCNRSNRETTMSAYRQFINQPGDVISEALEGLAATHPTLLRLDAGSSLISRLQPARNKVGLVSGGGSGHEPLHAGFVGVGMLDVAVAGAVFASPTADQVHAGTKLADSGAGVLQIVKNYTGDVLNFQIAAELAADDGVQVESVIVDDDLASDSDNDGPGRRGTAAVITVEKVCGALAEQGANLAAVAAAGRDVVSRSRTLALALTGCTHPGDQTPAFELEADEVEFGVGIHGERGTARIPYSNADELTHQLVAPLVAELHIARGQPVIAIVNGLGGTYPLELSIVARQLHRILGAEGITIARSLVGSYVSSLDMHGISITLTVADDDLIAAWDAPVKTPTLVW